MRRYFIFAAVAGISLISLLFKKHPGVGNSQDDPSTSEVIENKYGNYCDDCGATIKDNAKYCVNCGKKL